MSLARRDFIKDAVAGWVLLSSPVAALSETPKANNKIVWVMLRGAMDSLHAVLPMADPDFMVHRAALVNPIKHQLLPLQNGFALHPALKNCHRWYHDQQCMPIVAVASGYRARSHFEAQDQMESGLDNTDHDNGWLARAVNQTQGQGLAIAQTVPIALRGPQLANTWYPSHFIPSDDDLLDRLALLYQHDDAFSQLLQSAVNTRDSLSMSNEGKSSTQFPLLAQRCGELVANNPAVNCAMLELGGWDTHNNASGRLNRQFKLLDKGLAALEKGLGKTWQETVVIVTTEFGRTVAINGTKGTDHGTGSAMFLLGGAVQGQQVSGKWPSLAPGKLYQNRDLMPTSDVRSWIGGVLQQHWSLSSNQVKQVFPDVAPVMQAIIKM